MLFTEPVFLFAFLPLLLALHLPRGPRYRNALLLVASVAFYASGAGAFTVFVLGSIVVNYFAALAIDRWRDHPRGRPLLFGVVLVNLLALGVFKYADFLTANVNALREAVGSRPLPLPGLLLPIGISFFTFHAISYVVDVSRRHAVAQKGIVEAALYLLLFPQLIAGPIIRYRDISAQLVARSISMDDFADGVRRFILGLGKKMLIANVVAVPVDRIFSLPTSQMTTALAWIAVVCYATQIYFDFSGYSDMAIGLARMFGFRFPENFNYPYVARSVQDFWRRWHLSLSAWFRDYLYVPLGGNRGSTSRTYLNLVTVFFLCGLWHGANWTFIVWGLFHGLFLVLERAGLAAVLAGLPRVARHVYALAVVLVGWVFFRAETLSQAISVLSALAGFGGTEAPPYTPAWYVSADVMLALAAGALGSTPWLSLVAARMDRTLTDGSGRMGAMASCAASVGLWVVLAASLMLVAARTYDPFIYFRF